MSTELKTLLTLDELCELVQVSPRTVRRWLAAGTIPSLRAGTLVRFDPDEIDAWLRSKAGSMSRHPVNSGGAK